MTTLQHIELFLDATYPLQEQKRFIFSSRCICNYLERSLAILKYRSPYSRINIHCTTDYRLARISPLKHEPYLEAYIPVELQALDSIPLNSVQKQFTHVIACGLEACNTFTPIPIDKCLQALGEFEAAGFKNQWTHLDKTWARWNCRCVIAAELTVDNCTIEQSVYGNDGSVCKRRIAETKPREGLFCEYLGDASIDKQGIINYKKRGKILSAFDLNNKCFIKQIK